jgi:hypothetical protein
MVMWGMTCVLAVQVWHHLHRDCRQGLHEEDKYTWKQVNASEKRGPPATPLSTSQFTLNVLGQETYGSLIAEGWIQGKPCRVTIDIGTSITVAQPDIFAGQPKRKPSRAYVLQTASGETIPLLKEALVKLTLGWRTLMIWLFIAEVWLISHWG